MSFQRGEVVLADLPYSDRTGSKPRPVLIVSTDANNAVIDDVIVAAISTVTRAGAFTHVFVDPGTPDGQSSGLLHPSYVQCENLFTLDQQLILRPLGRLAPVLMRQVEAGLRAALGLP
jgi:mRNA-degrading endonuclease toxin of MazEF toxin-antitoxin module